MLSQERSLEIQADDIKKAFDNLSVEKKAYEDTLAELLNDKGPSMPESLDYFIERQGVAVQEAEMKVTILKNNAEHANKKLLAISFALNNLHFAVSGVDALCLTGPTLEPLQLTSDETHFSEQHLFKLILLTNKHLSMISTIIAQRKPRQYFFSNK